MILVIAVTSSILICGFLLFQFLKKNRHIKLNEVQRTLGKLLALKDILIHIQQHRGLSTSVLHGDDRQRTPLLSKKNNIHSLFESLISHYPELRQDSLFEGIYAHWQRLKNKCLELSASNNIVQHNRLITNLLYLIENQAEENRLLMHYTREAALEVIWKELLETIEAIGQTRAIGMGLISEGKSTAVERIQLKYLSDKVCSRLEMLNTSFSGAPGSSNRAHECHNIDAHDYIKTAENKINQLQTLINSHLLVQEIKGISGDHFFQLASAAIEPLDALFNVSSHKIKNLSMIKD